ncbi:MAG: hypothetical protein E7280_11150 [Lachnospiraceae bacterium]|nr:hypothetical protein [Lachnospiraceae bacterium]
MMNRIKEEWLYLTLTKRQKCFIAYLLLAMFMLSVYPVFFLHVAVMAVMDSHWILKRSTLVRSSKLGKSLDRKSEIRLHFVLELFFLSVLMVFAVLQYYNSDMCVKEKILAGFGPILLTLPYFGILGGGKGLESLYMMTFFWMLPGIFFRTYWDYMPVSECVRGWLRQYTIWEVVGITFLVWIISFGIEMLVDEIILEQPFFRRRWEKINFR